MPTITSNGTGGGLWGTGATWAGGVVPADNEDVVIAAGDVVTMNIDTSGYANGLASVLVQSHDSTPGTLRWMNGYDGILKIKTGSATTNVLQGNDTSATCLGRVLANYSGLWTAGTTSAKFLASQSGATGTVADGGGDKRIFTPAVSPSWVVDALIGESININGTVYAIEDNDATTATLTTGPSIGATVTSWALVVRPLPAANTCKILLGAVASVLTRYLDCALYSNEPTTKSVRTYGTTSTFTGATDDILTLNISTSIILTNGTPVYLSTSGTLPAGLSTGTLYYVRDVSGATCKLETSVGGGAVDITDTGTGVHCITHGILNVTSIAANLITMACALPATPWANDRPVMFTSSGTYPTGIEPNTVYYIRNLTAALGTFNIALFSGGPNLTLGTTWTGTLRAYIGSAATTCTSVAVLDDITGESTTWVPTAGSTFAETLGLSAVVLADEGPVAYDQQRLGLVAATSATMTLSAAIDSDQYPNSRIWLMSRNVAIQSPTATSTLAIVSATSNTTGGIFGEIRSTAGTGTTFNGYGIGSGTSCTATTISGCTSGISSGTSCTATTISGCTSGISSGTSCTATTISGCLTGISSGTSHTATTISGCSTGISSGNVILVGGGILTSTTRDVYRPRSVIGYGVSLQCATPVVDYLNAAESLTNNSCGVTIYDLKSNTGDAQPGCIGRWDVGGKTISTAFVAGTHDASAQIEALYGSASPPCCIHVTTTENESSTPATIKHILDIPLWSRKGEDLKVNVYAKQVATGFDERAKFSIVDLGAGGTTTGEVLDSWTVTDNTDWQTDELASGERDQEGPLVLRLEVRGQSKSLYWFQELPEPAGAPAASSVAFSFGSRFARRA
jgi:hypothetical protein